MKTPKPLRPGDQVAIVSTARKIKRSEIEYAISLLKRWGLVPVLGKTIGSQEHQYAGNDVARAADFQEHMDSDAIRAIWCARGGYGTVRVIDHLDFSKFQQVPKWIIGYSDVTVLHSHLHGLGVQTLHAAMPIDIGNCTQQTAASLHQAVFGASIAYAIKASQKNRLGKGTGTLVGGNLSILYSLCGSSSALHTCGKILFIEDLEEYLYHVDRMLQNLKRNGMLSDLQALIVGGMTKMHDNAIPFGKKAKQIILDAVATYDYPVLFDFPAGHQEANNALVLGAKVTVEVNSTTANVTYCN